MMKLASKKMVKIVSLSVAALFVLGIVASFAVQGTGVASAETNSNVGVVNMQMVVTQHPDFAKAQQALQTENQTLQKEFADKSATMSDKEKQDYAQQLEQRMQMKQQELLVPLYDKVNAAIKALADAKGLAIVVDKGAVIFGGVDITDDIIKSYTAK